MKLKETNKLDIPKLGKSEICPEEKVFPEYGLYRCLYQPDEENEDLKRRATDFIWSKTRNVG